MNTKKPYLSKTLWLNLIVAVLAMAKPEWIPFVQDPNYVLVAMALINGVLRLVTDKKIQLT